MITHYDMGSCELIAEPATATGPDLAAPPYPAVQLRLQTVAETLAPAASRSTPGLPPDIAGVEVHRFIAGQR